jgi:TonB family protein
MVRLSDAEVVVVIRIGPQGVLESVKVVEHSDDPTFDIALESAIRRSIPMLGSPPTPPGGAVPLSIPMRFHVMR